MLNNNKAQRVRRRRQKVSSKCVLMGNVLHWPTTSTSFPFNKRAWQIFLPIFISFMPLRVAFTVVYNFFVFSPTSKLAAAKARQPSDYLIFRKRFQEILIGILCMLWSMSWGKEERKWNCLNTKTKFHGSLLVERKTNTHAPKMRMFYSRILI